MSAAVAFAATPVQYKPVTVNLTGGPATTKVAFTVTDGSAATIIAPVTTDGSGAASFTYVPQSTTLTVDVRPFTEHTGTTAANATTGAIAVTRGFK